jgi:putative exporter of polyketide antibiotics
VPVDDFAIVPFMLQLLVTAALVAAGLWGYERRDVVTG